MIRTASRDQGCLAGGGRMGERMRAMDWSRTPLGPVKKWPSHLRSALSICLNSRFPIAIYWGPEFTLLYNDAYSSIPGDKHPWALGRPAREAWPEIWGILGPWFEGVLSSGEASHWKDHLLPMRRHGYTEECYFDLSLDPIRGERGSVGGIFNAVLETTYRVLGERRMRLLRRLAERTAGARSAGEVCALAAEAMGTATADVPFALLYLADPDGRRARLASAMGILADGPARDADLRPRRHRRPAPLAAKLAGTDACPWPLSTVAATGKPELVSGLAERFGRLPGGPWPEPARQALVLPIAATGLGGTAGLLVAGLSPRRTLDDEYRGFLELVAGHLATAVAAARAHELERRRVESLAELDRDRTAFFSNISHEFRTPLTLTLGALENLLAAREEPSPAELREQLVMAHRNGLRLMKLVNTLLDFSRIEAGRAHASYEPTDLAALSADLAGSFRSGCEQAGLRLVVDCPALPSQVHVDRDMWEKIVLNLLSNAFKYTLEGEIEVRLRAAGAGCELTVRDTGVGIPEPELLRVFERFHRVEAQRGRTHEGTGIGLALVKELVDLHGGSVRVESAVGRGSVFAVRVPFGTAHLPAARLGTARELASRVLGSRPYVEEALRWIPAGGSSESAAEPSLEPDGMPRAPLPGAEQGRSSGRPLVLWADDNADLREYVRRLLAPRFEVEAVPDGETALEAARRRRPDLVLADVMMPRLDGFALLRELRSDPRLRTVPVILLSARAGEESQVEGLEAGADDYLVKPFSARELLVRVGANLELARARQEVERAAGREEALREANRRKDEFLAVLSHELRNPLAPIRNSLYILDRTEPGGAQAACAKAIIGRQVDHLARLVDDLLDATRIASGKTQLARDRIELSEIVRRAVEDQQPEFERRGIGLQLRTDGAQLWIDADPTRISQVVGNLLHNAAKFSDPGGRVTVCVGRDDAGTAVLQVADEGLGIAPELMPLLFQPFSQADASSHRARGGLGLGLSLVKGLVELHGGTVVAHSGGAGRGAEFTVRLPRLPESRESREPAWPRLGRVGTPARKVLVVEDNRDHAETLSALLALGGHEVEEAHDGPTGVEKARAFHPDVVLCDLGLPGMSGYEVARALRADPELASAVLVAVTGYTQPDDRRRSADAGFDRHLGKPISLEQLEAAIGMEGGGQAGGS